MKKFVLRRKTNESEGDKFEYLINGCSNGINISTPFKDKATIYDEFSDVFVSGKGWEFIEVK